MKKLLNVTVVFFSIINLSNAFFGKFGGGGTSLSQIAELAKNSSCVSNWKRGAPPAAFVSGMALTFAKSFCRLRDRQEVARVMGQTNSKNEFRDALHHYGSNFDRLKIDTKKDESEALKSVYTLGVGLGIKESNGQYCEGWDVAAGDGRPSAQAEAGLFQASYSAIGDNDELDEIYGEYKSGNGSGCLLPIYAEGIRCKERDIMGSGEGASFQRLSKTCPAFAAEFSMIALRVNRTHFGPINNKSPEVNPGCYQLFDQVEKIVEDNSSLCSQLL